MSRSQVSSYELAIVSFLRCGDDDLGVWDVLVKGRVLALLVRGDNKLVALLLDPLLKTKLVLSGTEKSWLVSGVLVALW